MKDLREQRVRREELKAVGKAFVIGLTGMGFMLLVAAADKARKR